MELDISRAAPLESQARGRILCGANTSELGTIHNKPVRVLLTALQPKGKGMRYFTILLTFTVLLSGCSRKTPVEHLADNATTQVIALEKSLPEQCKTEAIDIQIQAIKATIARMPEACELQIKPIRQQRNGFAAALVAIMLGLFAFLWIRR